MLLVNLLPWRQHRLRKHARLWLMILFLQLLVATAFFGTVYSIWHRQYIQLQRELHEVSERRQQRLLHYQQVRQVWETLQNHQAQREADRQGRHHNQRYISVLEQLSPMVPERLWLTEIIDRGTHLSIVGMSENYPEIVNFNRTLGRHPAMARVSVVNAVRLQNGRSLLRFSLRADWQLKGPDVQGVDHD